MIFGDLPPSSSDTRFRLPAEACKNQLADFGRTGESDLVDVRMAGDRGARGLAETRDDIDHAFGNPRFENQFAEAQRGERGLLGRLDDADVAAGERRRDFPCEHRERDHSTE